MEYIVPIYQPSRFLLDNQAKILPILPENCQIPLFVLTCDAPCLYILNGHTAFFQAKYSKIDTFLKQRFIRRCVLGKLMVVVGITYFAVNYILHCCCLLATREKLLFWYNRLQEFCHTVVCPQTTRNAQSLQH